MNRLLNRRMIHELLVRIEMQRIRLVAVVPTQIATRQEGHDLPLQGSRELLLRVDSGETERELIHVEPLRDVEAAAHDKRLHGGIPTALRFAARHLPEEDAQLRVEKCDVSSTEYLRDERSFVTKNARRDAERGKEKLALHVDVHVVEARHIRRSVTNHELRLLSVEVVNNLVGSRF